VDENHQEKTETIWHLVCVEPGIFGPGPDYDLLVRRCGAFAGVSAKDLTIENGTARLGFGQPPFSSEELARTNTQTMARALDRAGLRKRWQEALESGSRKEMIDGLKAPPDILPRGFVMSNTIAALLTQAGLVFVAVFAEMMRIRMRGGWDFWLYIKVVAGISAIVSLPWLARVVWRFIRHGTPERACDRLDRQSWKRWSMRDQSGGGHESLLCLPARTGMAPCFAPLPGEEEPSKRFFFELWGKFSRPSRTQDICWHVRGCGGFFGKTISRFLRCWHEKKSLQKCLLRNGAVLWGRWTLFTHVHRRAEGCC
jgi:hypothetical protein